MPSAIDASSRHRITGEKKMNGRRDSRVMTAWLPWAMALVPLVACSSDSATAPALDLFVSAAVMSPGGVSTLAVVSATDSTVTLRWTQISDGAGQPARYRLKYALPPIAWGSAAIGCNEKGTQIGALMSCTVGGLAPGTAYDFQLMSYRLQGGAWKNALYSNIATGQTTTPAASAAGRVGDLVVAATTDSSLTVSWTQVDDGAGAPASYRVKYAIPSIQWSSATVGCASTISGTQIGAPMSCTIDGLASGTTYDVELMSFRLVDGAWQGATYSNTATGTVEDRGIWVSASRLRQLPTTGPAWDNVLAAANSACGTVDLTDQEQNTNVCIMAKALVFARVGGPQYRADVATAVTQIVSAPTYSGRALSLGRELGAYVIAADLIDLKGFDPTLDGLFRARLRTLRTTYTTGAATSLIDCHERRPNNWGAHCGATRVAIALYLGDTADLARAAQVFKGYLGDRSSYAGFEYGADLSWQCDPTRPVGINPVGCARDGSLDGVLPDDQRRGGSFTTSPPDENYVWEALQGLLAQAVMLERAGYSPFDWENRALLRSAQWLYNVNDFPATGDDTWQVPLLNHYYGSSFPEQIPSRAGKNVGWTDWTHS
jgi:hypothetical protein